MFLASCSLLNRWQVHYPKGSVLFYEGESSFDLFLILDGEASTLSADFRILEPFDAEDTRLQTIGLNEKAPKQRRNMLCAGHGLQKIAFC